MIFPDNLREYFLALNKNMKQIVCNTKESRWNDYRAVIATFITHLNSINVGMCQGYSAILLPQLLNPIDDTDDVLMINSEEASWIASLGVLSNPVGALLSGLLMDACGRKTTILYTTIPFVFGWTIIGLSENLYTLCLGRCISGLAIGMSSSCYVYVAEISTPSSRGFLSAFGPVFVSLGVLAVYSLGYILDWKTLAFICSITAALSFVAILFLPESPSWLATNGSLDEATKALLWFRKDQSATDNELADILETVKISRNTKPRSVKELVQYCRRGAVWKPFLILVAFFVFQELSGIYIVLYYAIDFFDRAGTHFNDYIASIMVGSLRFLVSIVGAVCIQHFSRKIMATTSSLFMSISMAVAAMYEHWYSEMEIDARPLVWIPLVSILINVSASMLGMLQLPWLMIGELFPLTIRGTMGGLVSSLAYLFIFVTVKFYPAMLQHLKVDGTMWMFSIASFLAIFYVMACLPETKDKTLFQIERAFMKSESGESKENLPSSIITQNTVPTISISVECKRI
ncbi:facilitated trehalose transporter Tret1-like isoform X2 [Planococcus citri]|uniref:facilitated trehalose transporter Tret1-like isoform X2 n=1 Tax=Planococcus citri TaxID=170843 RepID=UPI0031F83B17